MCTSIHQLQPPFSGPHAADAVNQAFRGAADDAGRELADGYSWAELRVQATAVDPGNGEQRVFELFFGTPGRDGLPVVVRLLAWPSSGAFGEEEVQENYNGCGAPSTAATLGDLPRVLHTQWQALLLWSCLLYCIPPPHLKPCPPPSQLPESSLPACGPCSTCWARSQEICCSCSTRAGKAALCRWRPRSCPAMQPARAQPCRMAMRYRRESSWVQQRPQLSSWACVGARQSRRPSCRCQRSRALHRQQLAPRQLLQ